jgi:hypothetical protein
MAGHQNPFVDSEDCFQSLLFKLQKGLISILKRYKIQKKPKKTFKKR